MEFRKGILFIRLIGMLTNKTVPKLEREVTDLIFENGIRNVVFNVEQLSEIDMEGIHALLRNYEICNQYHGVTLLCGLEQTLIKNRIEDSMLLHYMDTTATELTAFDVIH